MSKPVYRPIIFMLIFFAGVSCRKDHVEPTVDSVTDINDVVETKPPLQKPYSIAVDYNIKGYYAAVPFNYEKTTKSYPLLVFIPGGGQYGNGTNDLPLLLNDGPAQLADAGSFPASFSVQGKNFSFIVMTPQLTGYPSIESIRDFISYARKTYRIDSSRIYLSGLSIGGEVVCDVAGTYPSLVTAIVPMSGETGDRQTCASLAQHNIPVWDFHNSGDPLINISQSNNFIQWVNSYNPVIAPRQTIFPSMQHDAWTAALNPAYKENKMNIYEWMLQYSK